MNTGLPPTATDNCPTPPCFDSSSAVVVNGVTYYPQQTASTWRADYVDASPNGTNTPQDVTVAWSDNITGQYWTPRSKVRVETVLSETPTDTLTAYNMFSLSGAKRTELFATDGSTNQSSYRTVFSPLAHLTIQKLDGENGSPTFTCFDGAVDQSFGTEGGTGYSAEVNGSGNLIYGYNWDVASCSSDPTALPGWWRLTFKIDPSATIAGATVNYNTHLVALAPSGVLFIPKLDTANNQSTLDINITEISPKLARVEEKARRAAVSKPQRDGDVRSGVPTVSGHLIIIFSAALVTGIASLVFAYGGVSASANPGWPIRLAQGGPPGSDGSQMGGGMGPGMGGGMGYGMGGGSMMSPGSSATPGMPGMGHGWGHGQGPIHSPEYREQRRREREAWREQHRSQRRRGRSTGSTAVTPPSPPTPGGAAP